MDQNRTPGGQFDTDDSRRDDAGQLVQDELDLGDYVPRRAERTARLDDGRDVVTGDDGVQHWPDGAEQGPMF